MTVVVPIAVAVMALIGVIFTAVVSNQNDGDDRTSPMPEPAVQVVSWSSTHTPVSPNGLQLLLIFEGTSSNVPRNHSIFVLARVSDSKVATTSSAEDADASYQVSPPADIDDEGNWSITWQLTSVPEFAGYEVVIARLVQGMDVAPTSGASITPPTQIIDRLRTSGPDADEVVARDSVDMPPDA